MVDDEKESPLESVGPMHAVSVEHLELRSTGIATKLMGWVIGTGTLIFRLSANSGQPISSTWKTNSLARP
jgi:hypothetical protein